MLKISEIFEFSSETSWILKEYWPNADVKSSNGSIPRRSITWLNSGLEAASPDGIDFFEFNQRAGDVLEEGWDSPEDTIARTFKVIDANGEGNVDATEMRVAWAEDREY